MTNRHGDWIQTFTGRQVWPLDPQPEDIDLTDIAHALSLQCRYAGHVKEFYSVAEHCFSISRAVPPEAALWGLMHDATEAYLVDIPRPIKAALGPIYRDAEARLEACIIARFGLRLTPAIRAVVKEADTRILQMERDALMAPPPVPWSTDAAGGPLPGVTIVGYGPATIRAAFLRRFAELMKEV